MLPAMKVLLVNPDYEIERYMGRHFGRMGWVMPPMGLLYLAARLEEEGIDVAVYDAQIEERSLDAALAEERRFWQELPLVETIQIPNDDTGTRFSLIDTQGNGPWPAGRL
mgnify:CR=1 FL=1